MNMNFKKPSFLLLAILTGCSLAASAQNLAIVNGKSIPSSRADSMIQQMLKQGQEDTPQLRQLVREELINREVLIQEANRLGLGNNEEIKNQIELARQSLIIRALVTEFVKKHPLGEADIQAEYDKLKSQLGDMEYHARHILVEKEEEAKDIIAKLKSGEKFEELAKLSKDTGSAANGGDLDWANPASFVKPFSEAMVTLKKGQITETPVKSQFGFHVIKLEETRAAKVPTLEEVKQQIAESIQQKKLQAYQKELRAKAKVK